MDRFKHILKKLALTLFFLTILVVAGLLIFNSQCSSAPNNFKSIQTSFSKEALTAEASILGYHRAEETTYLSWPEWYLVFNPQEYGRFLSDHLPDRFPYFQSVKQVWTGYCYMYGLTKSTYPLNIGDHIVEGVIVTSSSMEYVIEGLYGHTIGRLSDWSADGQQTEEDMYAAKVATEYGQFVPDLPWYAFPFGHKLAGLWKTTPLAGPHPIRKWERKISLSIEYGIKSIYAHLIGLGTHATFGTAASVIYVHATQVPAEVFMDPKIKKVKDFGGGEYLMAVPHYQGFTDIVPGLSMQGVRFVDIAGNDEILMTVVAPAEWEFDLASSTELFSMPEPTDATRKRVAIQVPVSSLTNNLNALKKEGVILEHLYDY